MQLVYVLISNSHDFLIEMTFLSAWSARYHHKDLKIIVVTDCSTQGKLSDNKYGLLDLIDDIIVVNFPENESPIYRSRYLKTKLRNLVSGDFFFIDCDTIFLSELPRWSRMDADIAAVPDWMEGTNSWPENIFNLAQERTIALGIDLKKEDIYYNSGVIWYADTKQAHRFAELWHQYYLDYYSEIGFDQPSFCKANILSGHQIKSLPNAFNCQMNAHPPRPQDASVLHFAANSRNYSWLYSKKVLERIKNFGIQDELITYGILHPLDTCLITAAQCREMSFRSCCQNIKKYTGLFRKFAKSIDSNFEWLQARTIQLRIVKFLLRHKAYYAASQAAILPKWVYAKLQLNG